MVEEKHQNKRKQYLYLPYVGKIITEPKRLSIQYKGSNVEIEWKDIHSIMFYGESCDIPQVFFEKCALYKIPVIIHRRNMPRAVIIAPTLPPDQENILTQQVIYRENSKKRTYITKKLLQAKFQSMSWLIPVNHDLLFGIFDEKKMLSIESWHARRYWEEFFQRLDMKTQRRAKDTIASSILNAVSKFISGILLRWILYHNLSPYHGFIHKPTDYPSLVYDLMEPYRGYFDKVVFDTLMEHRSKASTTSDSVLMGIVIENLKTFLDTHVYVQATRQIVTFQELLHGSVLSLRAYLLKTTQRFIVPHPAKPNGGRPINAGFKLYGHTAGITNFWPETKQIAEQFEQVLYGSSGRDYRITK